MAFQTCEPDDVRQAAGLVMKSYMVQRWEQIHPNVKTYMQSCTLQAIGDASPFVRVAAGVIVRVTNHCYHVFLIALPGVDYRDGFSGRCDWMARAFSGAHRLARQSTT